MLSVLACVCVRGGSTCFQVFPSLRMDGTLTLLLMAGPWLCTSPAHTSATAGSTTKSPEVLRRLEIKLSMPVTFSHRISAPWNETAERTRGGLINVFLCNENSFFFVSLSFSSSGCQPQPKSTAAWQAGWLPARRFGQLPKLCFPVRLKQDSLPFLDFASVPGSSVISCVICAFSVARGLL